jgi:uncharacterized protein YkwD
MKPIIILFISILINTLSYSQLSDANKIHLQKEIHKRVNELRISLKLSPLKLSDTLSNAAKIQSDFMAETKNLSHTHTTKKLKTPSDRISISKGIDFEIVGENILQIPLPKGKLSSADISKLANEMFEMWKKSKGHYQNMIHSSFTYEGFAFTETKELSDIYVTQVFGKRGTVVKQQLSNNSFGLKPRTKDCDSAYKAYDNLVKNMGNNLFVEGDKIFFYYNDVQLLKKIFSKSNDGLAIDILEKYQFPCKNQNILDFSPYYDGVLLKPVLQAELFKKNEALSSYRLIAEVGTLPKHLVNKEISLSLILIKNGGLCEYLTPFEVPSKMYPLTPYQPTLVDTNKVKFIQAGIVESQEIIYDFSTNSKEPLFIPTIKKSGFPISMIKIRSYSSVEGDSIKNVELHNSRAQTIKSDLAKRLNVNASSFKIDAQENWNKMNFQFELFGLDSINKLSFSHQRNFINERSYFLDWDSLLFAQRKSTATIFYLGDFTNSKDTTKLALLNLHSAILSKNDKIINKALKHIYFKKYEDNLVVFEDEIYEYLFNNVEFVENTAAVLSKVYLHDIHRSTEFLKYWVNKKEKLSTEAINNLLHLYSLLGTYFLDNWDVSNERLSNVVHPEKMLQLLNNKISKDLMFNLHLTFIRYYGQINNSRKIDESFDFIINYIKSKELTANELKDLALFCNYWSMYDMSVEFLLPKFKEDKLNLEGSFILAQTIIHSKQKQEDINKVVLKSAEFDNKKWCKWVKNDFQLKRNEVLKSKYCEICN